MKIEKTINSYHEYQDYLTKKLAGFEAKNIDFYLKENTILDDLMNKMPSAVLIVNYQTSKFLYCSKSVKNMFGVDADEFTKSTQIEMMQEYMHPEDITKLSNFYLPRFIQSVSEIEKSELKNYIFSCNFRIRRIDGLYIHTLQRSTVLETYNDSVPLINLSNITDISNFKSDNRMIFSISRYDQNHGFVTIANELLGEDFKIKKLTSKEIEVLILLAQGLSAKEISEKLLTSIFTTKAHIRNIKIKVSLTKSTELVQYAISNGIYTNSN